MKDGSSLEEAKIKAAIKGEGLEFVSMEESNLVRPKAAFELVVSGAT